MTDFVQGVVFSLLIVSVLFNAGQADKISQLRNKNCISKRRIEEST